MTPTVYYTPPEVAKLYRVDVHKIVRMIRSGELQAIDVSERGSRRPRFRIAASDLEVWKVTRTVQPPVKPVRRKRQPEGIIEFFK